jgi:hypothetical protein
MKANKKANFMEEILYEAMEDPYVGNSIDEVVHRIAVDFKLTPSDCRALEDSAASVNPTFMREMRNR